MDRNTKSKLRKMVIEAYNEFAPSIYREFSNRYPTTEIRLEILKALQNHIMQKTSDALRKKLKRKKERRIENAPSYDDVVEQIEKAENEFWLEIIE